MFALHRRQIRRCVGDGLQPGFSSTDTVTIGRAAPLARFSFCGATSWYTSKQVRKKTSRNQPGFRLAAELKRVTGVDLTRIDGVQARTLRTVISEAGLDMSRRPSEAHFVSWLGLASALEWAPGDAQGDGGQAGSTDLSDAEVRGGKCGPGSGSP